MVVIDSVVFYKFFWRDLTFYIVSAINYIFKKKKRALYHNGLGLSLAFLRKISQNNFSKNSVILFN